MVRHHRLPVPKRMQVSQIFCLYCETSDITVNVHENNVGIIERIFEEHEGQKVEKSDPSLADATVKL